MAEFNTEENRWKTLRQNQPTRVASFFAGAGAYAALKTIV